MLIVASWYLAVTQLSHNEKPLKARPSLGPGESIAYVDIQDALATAGNIFSLIYIGNCCNHVLTFSATDIAWGSTVLPVKMEFIIDNNWVRAV